jgi:hypothetical protein
VPLPSHFEPAIETMGAFDHDEAILSGIGGTHDTVSILYHIDTSALDLIETKDGA